MKKHGTQYAYRTGCRCQDCKDWKSSDARKYRQRRRERGERLVHGKWITTPLGSL